MATLASSRPRPGDFTTVKGGETGLGREPSKVQQWEFQLLTSLSHIRMPATEVRAMAPWVKGLLVHV